MKIHKRDVELWFRRKTLRKSLSCLSQSPVIYYICLLQPLPDPRCVRWEFPWAVLRLPPTVLRGHGSSPPPFLPDSQRGHPPPRTHWGTQFSPGITLPQAGQYPLWQAPAGLDGQGQPWGFVSMHSPCLPDLHNWKNNMPSYCDGPKGRETLSTSIFATHRPKGADI